MASPSPLLQLPRELRNMIYELVILDQPIGIKEGASPQQSAQPGTSLFTSKEAIILASQQIHDEYLEIQSKLATSPKFPEVVIEVVISHMDFAKLVAFSEVTAPSDRSVISTKLHVKLAFTKATTADVRKQTVGLAKWARSCQSTGMMAGYEVHRDGETAVTLGDGRGIQDFARFFSTHAALTREATTVVDVLLGWKPKRSRDQQRPSWEQQKPSRRTKNMGRQTWGDRYRDSGC
ncbi:hypothetical protein LTR36_000259 [Oleoguttula mirabilis]|uniref:Uncharacterized protein n=1 Tax=Oleoguttula mirabilis TaxID=1507867 RepID=A0AAV9JZ78_9PEZI|nr:hypothetical protein LTR36_000259 [Oleoguttula mirabilis]